MKEAYIVAAKRSAVGKAGKGSFRFFRSDDLAVEIIQALIQSVPGVDPKSINDVIVG